MRIGYYAHHHGSGHCRQIDKLAALLPKQQRTQITVFTSLPADSYRFRHISEAQIVRLHAEDERPDDVLPGRAGKYWQPQCLHYSPVGNRDIQMRSYQILTTLQERQIELMIIDVSAEVAMLCRAASVPYLYVRLPGERDDPPHLTAFAGALGLLAPYPQALEATTTPKWVQQKTLYLDFIPDTATALPTYAQFIEMLCGYLSDASGASLLRRLRARGDDTATDTTADPTIEMATEMATRPVRIVTVIKGYGGHEAIDARLPQIRDALPEAMIVSLGPIKDSVRDCVDVATHVDDVAPFIAYSDLLFMACGLNAVAQAYAYQTPLVVLPDARPHREQDVMAAALIDQGRARSWTQFIADKDNRDNRMMVADTRQMSNRYDQGVTSTMATMTTTKHVESPAQAAMHSLVDCATCKAWFEQWLLPQLAIRQQV